MVKHTLGNWLAYGKMRKPNKDKTSRRLFKLYLDLCVCVCVHDSSGSACCAKAVDDVFVV